MSRIRWSVPLVALLAVLTLAGCYPITESNPPFNIGPNTYHRYRGGESEHVFLLCMFGEPSVIVHNAAAGGLDPTAVVTISDWPRAQEIWEFIWHGNRANIDNIVHDFPTDYLSNLCIGWYEEPGGPIQVNVGVQRPLG